MSDSVRPHRSQPTRLPHPWDSPGKNTGVGCHFLLQCMKVKSESEVAQSCLTLRDPWTAAFQAPLSMGCSRQEYWSGVPLPSLLFSPRGSQSGRGRGREEKDEGTGHAPIPTAESLTLLLIIFGRLRSSLLHAGFLWLWCVGATPLLGCRGFLLRWLLLLRHMGSVAQKHVESSQTRDQTIVPCIDRQTPNQWTTREVPDCSVLTPMSDPSQREGK